MFPQVSPSLFAFDFASLTIVFCAPFVFMVLRIAFAATPLDSHLYKLPGGVGVRQAKPSAEFVQWTLTTLNSSAYEVLSFRTRVAHSFSVKSKPFGQNTRGGCPRHSPMFRFSLFPRRQNRSTAWQV